MQTFIKFPSINQYRQIVQSVRKSAEYHSVPYPTVLFEGTVKIHGTNAGMLRPFNGSASDIYFQSRERILSIESDNAGFCLWGNNCREKIQEVMEKFKAEIIAKEPDVDHSNDILQIFGEWFGGNIQDSVGVNGLPKMFCAFGLRVSGDAESSNWYGIDTYNAIFDMSKSKDKWMFTKYDFPVFYFSIDFNNAAEHQNDLVAVMESIEKDCPVARFFKPDAEPNSLVGEGLVIVPVYGQKVAFDVSSYMGKCKGDKHSASKVKTLKSLDPEKMQSMDEFVEKTVTENRLKQGYDKMIELQLPLETKTVGTFIKWILSDVFREEADTMVASLIDPKEVSKPITIKARNWFFDKLNETAGV